MLRPGDPGCIDNSTQEVSGPVDSIHPAERHPQGVVSQCEVPVPTGGGCIDVWVVSQYEVPVPTGGGCIDVWVVRSTDRDTASLY